MCEDQMDMFVGLENLPSIVRCDGYRGVSEIYDF